MIKYSGKTNTIAKVYREGEEPYIAIINLEDYTLTDGKYYNSTKQLYIDTIITTGKEVEDKEITSFYYVNLVITKITKGFNTIWELISSCFGSGTWREGASWSETETWKD